MKQNAKHNRLRPNMSANDPVNVPTVELAANPTIYLNIQRLHAKYFFKIMLGELYWKKYSHKAYSQQGNLLGSISILTIKSVNIRALQPIRKQCQKIWCKEDFLKFLKLWVE